MGGLPGSMAIDAIEKMASPHQYLASQLRSEPEDTGEIKLHRALLIESFKNLQGKGVFPFQLKTASQSIIQRIIEEAKAWFFTNKPGGISLQTCCYILGMEIEYVQVMAKKVMKIKIDAEAQKALYIHIRHGGPEQKPCITR